MMNNLIKDYLILGQQYGVPLQHTVALICHAREDQLSDLAQRCGVHRNTLYKSLSGVMTVNKKLMASVAIEFEGFNPWDYNGGKKNETE